MTMSKDKEIISRLFKIVAKQQAVLTKLAQAQSAPTPPNPAAAGLKAAVQADVVEYLYGRGVKLIPGKTYAQVQYANIAQTPQGNSLIVGVTVPPAVQEKWSRGKDQITPSLVKKYSAMLGQPISSIQWRG